jgi:glycerophosphoryl diester phosphodiesterase
MAAVAESGLSARTTLMAFNPDVLRRLGELAPGQRRSLLVGAGHVTMAQATPVDTIEWARELGATDVGLEHTLIDDRVVARARSAGLSLGVWTVNDEAAIVSALQLGVDALTTDRPDLALRLAAAQ